MSSRQVAADGSRARCSWTRCSYLSKQHHPLIIPNFQGSWADIPARGAEDRRRWPRVEATGPCAFRPAGVEKRAGGHASAPLCRADTGRVARAFRAPRDRHAVPQGPHRVCWRKRQVIGGTARKTRLLPTIRHFQPNPSGVHKIIVSAARECAARKQQRPSAPRSGSHETARAPKELPRCLRGACRARGANPSRGL
jgi:hypothetical protein